MASVEAKVKFLEKYWRTPKGRSYSLEGRDWVWDYYRSIGGFKTWPVNKNRLCPLCHAAWGQIIETPHILDDTRTEVHRAENGGCTGLEATPIYYVFFKADRRTGKTYNFGGFCGATIFTESWQTIGFVATSGGQTEDLAQDNFKGPIEANKQLNSRADIKSKVITVPKLKSKIKFFNTVPRATTGRGMGIVGIDESRDVDSKTALAVLPSIQEVSGIKCTKCYYNTQGIPSQRTSHCPNCGEHLREWYGCAVAMSSAGLIHDRPDKDWFYHLTNKLRDAPDQNAHFIEINEASAANPDFNEDAKDAAKRIFSGVEGLKALVDVEWGGQFRREGSTFLSEYDILKCATEELINAISSDRLCVAFLDTSVVSHLTSFLIYSSTSPELVPAFSSGLVEHINVWDPKLKGPDGRLLLPHGIKPEEIEAYIKNIYLGFPNLVGIWVDVRNAKGVPWAKRMCERLLREEKNGIGRLIIPVDESFGMNQRNAGWSELERLILGDLISYPPHPQLIKELKNAIWKMNRGNLQIRESTASNHLDVSENLATCCYLGYDYANRPKQTGMAELRNESPVTKSRIDEINKRLMNKLGNPRF